MPTPAEPEHRQLSPDEVGQASSHIRRPKWKAYLPTVFAVFVLLSLAGGVIYYAVSHSWRDQDTWTLDDVARTWPPYEQVFQGLGMPYEDHDGNLVLTLGSIDIRYNSETIVASYDYPPHGEAYTALQTLCLNLNPKCRAIAGSMFLCAELPHMPPMYYGVYRLSVIDTEAGRHLRIVRQDPDEAFNSQTGENSAAN